MDIYGKIECLFAKGGHKNGICQIRKYGYQRIENLLRLHEFWEGRNDA